MMSDRLYLVGIQKAIKIQSKVGGRFPLSFYYYRSQQNPILTSELLSKETVDFGTSHGSDVFLIYQNYVRAHPFNLTGDDKLMQSTLIDVYENFIKNG